MHEPIDATDIIAIIIIIGAFILLFTGRDGTVSAVLSTIVGFYFGQKVEVTKRITDAKIKKETETPF